MTSHRSEMFGVLGAMCCIYSLNIQQRERPNNIIMYCDSLSVVNWFKQAKEEHYKHADDDIGIFILTVKKKLAMEVIIHHVKSHQKVTDTTPIEVKLNGLADHIATRQQRMIMEDQCRIPNQWDPIRAIIQQNGTLSTHTATTLRRSTHQSAIDEYHKKKFEWSDETLESIDREVQKRMMKKIPTNMAWFTVRMQCCLLPTNEFLHRQNRRTMATCRGCSHPVEDCMHIMGCNQRKHQWTQLSQKLRKFYEETSTPTAISSMINGAIQYTFWNRMDPSNHQPTIQQLKIDQHQIGWNQLCHGLVAKSMVNYMEKYYKDCQIGKKTGITWAANLCCTMCQWAYTQWIDRCDLEHSSRTGVTSVQEKNMTIAKMWYDRRHQLGTDHGRFFTEPWEIFRTRSPIYIANWVNVNNPALETLWKSRPKEPRQLSLFEAWKR